MWPHHAVLVEQGELALDFQHALDDEHDVRTTRVVLVETQRRRMLQGPRQDALLERRDLQTVFDDDGVLADEVDAADVAVQVDPDTRPVQPGGDLLHVRRLSRAVIPLDHHPAVMRESRQDRQRRVVVEMVGVIDVRHIVGALAEGGHIEILVQPEHVAHVDRDIRHHVGRQTRFVNTHRHMGPLAFGAGI